MLDICLLGCGGMMPLPDRWLTAVLVRYNGKMILIDCGEGTQIPLKLAGWGIKAIDALLITHYHADHIAGLPGFLLTLGNSGREEPLTIVGPPGLADVVKGLLIICPELPFNINLEELKPDNDKEFKMGDMVIKAAFSDHWLPCLSYSVEIMRAGLFDREKAERNNVPMSVWKKLQKGETCEVDGMAFTPDMVAGKTRKGIKVSYLTDSRPTQTLIDFVKGSDLFICEGMYGDDEQLQKAIDKKHMLFSEAAFMANESNSKELWLTHFSPALDNPEVYINKARAVFLNSHLGQDGMKKSLAFE